MQKRTANSAEETAKIDSSKSHSGSDRDSIRVRSDEMPDSGEATPTEHVSTDKRRSQEGVGRSEHACMRLDQRVKIRIFVYNEDILDEMWDHAGWNVLHCTHL